MVRLICVVRLKSTGWSNFAVPSRPKVGQEQAKHKDFGTGIVSEPLFVADPRASSPRKMWSQTFSGPFLAKFAAGTRTQSVGNDMGLSPFATSRAALGSMRFKICKILVIQKCHLAVQFMVTFGLMPVLTPVLRVGLVSMSAFV